MMKRGEEATISQQDERLPHPGPGHDRRQEGSGRAERRSDSHQRSLPLGASLSIIAQGGAIQEKQQSCSPGKYPDVLSPTRHSNRPLRESGAGVFPSGSAAFSPRSDCGGATDAERSISFPPYILALDEVIQPLRMDTVARPRSRAMYLPPYPNWVMLIQHTDPRD
jgi:hypothetical protein